MNNFKQIPNYPDYLINDKGQVFSKKCNTFKRLKESKTKKGYSTIRLSNNVKIKHFRIHRLVLMAFDRMPKNGEQTRHLDNDKSNNNISNIKWGTCQENSNDKWLVHKTGAMGEKHGKCKLTDKQVTEIRELYKTDSYTFRSLGEKFKVSNVTVCRIVNKLRRSTVI